MSEQHNQGPRDSNGRFAPGWRGGGRPVGKRNRLAEQFFDDMAAAWQRYGQQAMCEMATKDPSGFIRAFVGMLPKDFHLSVEQEGTVFGVLLDMTGDKANRALIERRAAELVEQRASAVAEEVECDDSVQQLPATLENSDTHPDGRSGER